MRAKRNEQFNKIVEFMNGRSAPIGTPDIIKFTGLPANTVKCVLLRLEADGFITRRRRVPKATMRGREDLWTRTT